MATVVLPSQSTLYLSAIRCTSFVLLGVRPVSVLALALMVADAMSVMPPTSWLIRSDERSVLGNSHDPRSAGVFVGQGRLCDTALQIRGQEMRCGHRLAGFGTKISCRRTTRLITLVPNTSTGPSGR